MTLRRFGTMPRLALAEPLPVEALVRAALDLPEAGWAEADGSKDELAQVMGVKPARCGHWIRLGWIGLGWTRLKWI